MMSDLPFVLQRSQLSAVVGVASSSDLPASEDPLPPAITIDASEYALGLSKRKTAVKGETLDGN
jgi:hypothetical protein